MSTIDSPISPTFLSIDTSTTGICSIALIRERKTIIERSCHQANHAEQIGPFTNEIMMEARQKELMPQAIVVSEGPGSYTGLRIGASLAKGLAFGLDLPIIAIPTLDLLAHSISEDERAKADFLITCLDARNSNLYVAIYDHELNPLKLVTFQQLSSDSFADYLQKGKCLIVGNCPAISQVINHPNALIDVQMRLPIASAAYSLALYKYQNRQFADTAYWQPFYLNEYKATVATNKVLSKYIKP